MGKILKKIIGCIVFICLFAVVFYKVDKLLEDKRGLSKYNQFYNSDTNFDVIFFGTSHTYHSVFTQELWKNYGITSYNWGYSHCTLAEDYYLLQEVVKYTDPKLVVIDLYGLTEYEEKGNGKYNTEKVELQHPQFDTIPFSSSKYTAIKDIFDDYYDNWDYLFNFALYHNRWGELTEYDFGSGYLKHKDNYQKGSSILFGHASTVYIPNAQYTQVDIDTKCAEYIPRIIEFCKEKDIKLQFVYLPYPAEEYQQNVAHTLEDYFVQYDSCSYRNFLDDGILDEMTDIYDDGSHVNYLGAYKITMELGKYLQETYGLKDYREDPEYASWDKDYEKYVNFKSGRFKRNQVIDNLILGYGGDYRIKLQVNAASDILKKNKVLKSLVKQYGDSLEVEYVENLSANEEDYETIIWIYDAKTDAEVMVTGTKM